MRQQRHGQRERSGGTRSDRCQCRWVPVDQLTARQNDLLELEEVLSMYYPNWIKRWSWLIEGTQHARG